MAKASTAANTDTPVAEEKKVATYTRDQVLQADKYRQYRDIAGIVLEKDKQYTADEIQQKIDRFLKAPIKEKVNGKE
ncbi:hypothetical protein P22_1965 [Propionispora sp. 2/2-37]|uniref:hypothetical protein n=1 Tax=Propionispora sp. 2/2-37 TaxID=1677858 RepID=UPI0006BB7A48|nr:hypothetical protein [Propionispora sp. 2/2-37]CUH95879.1 hypothetical protein P22_1965 [Propionispora sp. 2/2-37]